MNVFERSLQRKIHSEVPDLAEVTPGLVIEVYSRGRRKAHLRVGHTYDFYDLASLTKIIFTASSAMLYFAHEKPELRFPIRNVLPWWKASTTPFQLLTHTAGLDWWKPYYKSLKGPMTPALRWPQLKQKLHKSEPSVARKAVYSDLDLWMLGAFLEAAREQSLEQMWDEVHERLQLKQLFFHPGNKPLYRRARYAPTEDCRWRRKVLQGEVHDENTWALGGVAPHAGLFGSIEAVSDWGLKLRGAVLHEKKTFGSTTIAHEFTRRRIPRSVGDWGLCFMKPTKGKASCGKYFSAQSFGHTGFTGTSLWIDPVKDLLVVILSNRVHPTRDNLRFAALRPQLHDWISELV
jgi:CubicO group peptidase (beta-lactamase class C family)